ncbi:hypothetical protein ACF08M_32165 [Streptomyces sp. NPDC015032]|uniref:hypothetical protein n=1 Tax=Streptomyces sp. NPDC015032 TaxID=3364937 RepID=UPI0036FB39AD
MDAWATSAAGPDEILTGGTRPVFTDLGLHTGTILDQPGALAATASLRRTDQGPAQRIDRMHWTPDLALALLGIDALAPGWAVKQTPVGKQITCTLPAPNLLNV